MNAGYAVTFPTRSPGPRPADDGRAAPWPHGRVGLLASVAILAEVEQALALGADVIDLKDPARGALGAWPAALLPEAVDRAEGRRPISATVGDLPMAPELLVAAARRTAASGVDVVKVGFFAGGDHAACARALAQVAADGARLVAVLMADQRPDLGIVTALAEAGFFGAMLDTADKRGGGLRRHLDDKHLARFVADARGAGLLTGLAGSLGLADVGPLAELGPDYLGFRGALCGGGERTAGLDGVAFAEVRAALDAAAR
jgi:(5-formylfuran-3-yl)methyl phosphate synthase